VTGLQQMLAINVIVKHINLSENSHHYATQFWLTAESAALVANPVYRQS